MKRCLVVTLFCTLLLACTTPGTPVTPDNNLVQMPHYTVTAPADEGWQMQLTDDITETVVLSKKIGSTIFQMKLQRNLVLDPNTRAWPSRVVADDFRRLEERTMIELGVNRGRYEVKNLVKGERTIGDRTFYTMTYDAVTGSVRVHDALYLLFPKSEGNDSFFIAHYAEATSLDAEIAKSYKSDFEAFLQTLALR